MGKRFFDETYKKMAVDLSYEKGSVKQVADELGLSAPRLSKWRQLSVGPKQAAVELTAEQQEIKKLQKELKGAQLERDILKKAVGIFSKGDGRYSDL